MAFRLSLSAFPLWLVLVSFWSHIAYATLTVRPTDTVVLVNHSTYFNCSTSARNINAKFVLWYHYPVNSPTRNDVYDEGVIMFEYKDRFRIETNLAEGVFNLVAERPSLTDAGRYVCIDGIGHGEKAPAELIVLEGNPICESNIHSDGVVGQNSCDLKPDELWMTCCVTSFNGNKPPTLKWKRSNDESSSSLVVCNGSASCNLTQRGDEIMNGQSFVCQITKSTEQYGCSINVNVKYAVNWTKEITEAKGDVECSSNTSQPCTYKWYNNKSEEVSSNENLHTAIPGEYKCEARCEMNRQNESCIFIAMRVYIVSPDYGLYALFVLLTIPVICIAVYCLHKWYVRRKVINENTKNHSNGEATNIPVEPTERKSLLPEKTQPDAVDNPVELSAELSALPNITDQDMVDKLNINQYFIDKGISGAIYGPFRWENKKCALKQILFSPDELTKDMKENIHKQANHYKQLDHEHLVKVFKVWFPSPALYILMEYAEGKSLDKVLRPKDAPVPLPLFSDDIVQNWALQIADGMKYLHFKDLVHRNLKSAHVLVMELPDARPNILKIGSYTPIKQHDHATVMSIKGTMNWMAPEYIRGDKFSKLSDVWSYGVTVWEILTRELPFNEVRKETDIVRQAIKKTLKLKIPDSCSEPLRELLTDCWDYEVSERPSFQEICDYIRTPQTKKEPTTNPFETRSATELSAQSRIENMLIHHS